MLHQLPSALTQCGWKRHKCSVVGEMRAFWTCVAWGQVLSITLAGCLSQSLLIWSLIRPSQGMGRLVKLGVPSSLPDLRKLSAKVVCRAEAKTGSSDE
jgi:hypothetical protein